MKVDEILSSSVALCFSSPICPLDLQV